MSRWLGKRRLRNALSVVALSALGTVVLGHSYRLDDTGDFIVDDSNGVRRIVVSEGTQFSVSVSDTGQGCTADIRASKGSRRVASLSNPRSAGFVLSHTFHFNARKAGTTTYDITVRGEAFGGGEEHCDEDSHNPLEINVVKPGGDDRFFVAAVRPEIKSLKQALKQIQADLRTAFGGALSDYHAGQLSFILAMQQMMIALNFAFFQQALLTRNLINDMRAQARATILADNVLSALGVPNGLMRGGCGAWDNFVHDVNALLASSRTRSRADTKKYLGQLVNLYQRDGGIAEFTQWIDCDDCYDCEGVTLEDYLYEPQPTVKFSSIVGVTHRPPGSSDVLRQVLVGGEARGSGFTSVDLLLLGTAGELARQPRQVEIEPRFVEVLQLPVDELGIDFRIKAESSEVTLRGRGERFQEPILLVTPKIIQSDF